MEIHITARHMELTEGLRSHVEERIARLTRIYDRLDDLHVILTAEKRAQSVEISTSVNGHRLVSREQTPDVYTSVDGAVDKMERQIKTVRGKITHRKGRLPTRGDDEAREVVARVAVPANGGAMTVVREETLPIRTQTLEDALSELSSGTTDFVVFENQETEQVSLIYRRRDGNLGLIEPLG